ncbi:hypothetical protein ABPG77_008671 [Micractinium sp. CCAP 211/92]
MEKSSDVSVEPRGLEHEGPCHGSDVLELASSFPSTKAESSKAASSHAGPDVEAALQGLGTEDIRVLSRLCSASHDFPPAVLPPTRNPLVRAWRWWQFFLLPGMGMFSEAYFIFAIGNIEPLFAVEMPSCFGDTQPYTCDQETVSNIQNIEISAVIVGMLAFGYVADVIGRKWGSRLTMLIMFVGACLLTGAYGPTDQVFLSVFCFSLFFYALGVGGEYPLASSSAAEKAEGDPQLRKRRGETVVLAFSQQGWGNFVNTLVILLLLAMQGATGDLTSRQAELTWRLQFGVGAVICACVTAYRWLYLEESEVWQAEHKGVQEELAAGNEEAEVSGRGFWHEHWTVLRFYWPRLLVTCLGWVANDFAFYGNKLFQSQFINVISPGASRYVQMQWTLLNSGIALLGYYCAAFTIDRRWMGRRRLQCMGFMMMFVLFLLCGILYDEMIDHAISAFQTLYFLTSFFNQFGPNCTSFLVAGEVYPTDTRAFFHGISAASGKLGAIIAASVFSNVDTVTTFYASAAAGVVGALLTLVFLPDTTGLDLAEVDRMHRFMLAGQIHNYHGQAVHPRYLSLYERWRGYGKHFDAAKDAEQRRLQDAAASGGFEQAASSGRQ